MISYVINLKESSKANLLDVGGKGANLIELSKIENIDVPEGFCLTTKAYREVLENNDDFNSLLDQLSALHITENDKVKNITKELRRFIENIKIPKEIIEAVAAQHKMIGEESSYAVRSSATAEDLPRASFAGQHDTYLNIIGLDEIINHIKKCWASLFTDRAIMYRKQNDFNHRKVYISVVVQKMIMPEVSGIMFTADPVNSNRKVLSIDAGFGIGEALVSGIVSADVYKVKNSEIIDKKISDKTRGIYALKESGTEERLLDENLRNKPALSDNQILALEQIGRKIEGHFSYPQDIEWCIKDDKIYILQSRPITTLYPLGENHDGKIHLFVSAGHMQMMTAPVKPLGMYFYKSVLGNYPSQVIGGRLYADMTHDFSSPLGRIIAKKFIAMIGDDLITNSINQIIKDKKLIKSLPKGKDKVIKPENNSGVLSIMLNAYRIFKKNDPDIIKGLIAKEEDSIEKMKENIERLSGDEVFQFIAQDHENRRTKIATPENAGALTAVLLSEKWLNRKIEKWLGIKNASDTFIMSIPNSITTETGFALLDVADSARKYSEIIDYLKNPDDETFFDDISKLDGGETFNKALKDYMLKYGMRCSGDIDITVPRWIEQPSNIAPVILSNIKNFEPYASKVKYDEGLVESERRIEQIAEKVEKLPGGKKKAKKVRKIAGLVRNYIGFREYPKFSYIKRYYIYKQAMLKEADKLLPRGIINEIEDIYYLSFDELRNVVKTGSLDYEIIEKRKEEYKGYEKLTPPRVMTSEGEIITGTYDKGDIPENTLPGLAVSAGFVEGRARVVSSFEEADLEEGDILVTEFTDPSWTPLFVSIKGLVTEVGGLITHGAIIAREYGLPAVVSVENATKLIKDGQIIRINGTDGYVEILS